MLSIFQQHFTHFLGLCTLHTARTHCSPCSFLAPFNQSQQATFISFPYLMLHQANWLAGTAELPLIVCGLVFYFFFKKENTGCKIWLFMYGRTPTQRNCVHAYKIVLLIGKYCFPVEVASFYKAQGKWIENFRKFLVIYKIQMSPRDLMHWSILKCKYMTLCTWAFSKPALDTIPLSK